MNSKTVRKVRKILISYCFVGGAVVGFYGNAYGHVRGMLRAGLPSSARPLPANVLAQLRGRFEASNSIVYFGLEMQSHWVDGSGNGVTVGTDISLSLKGADPLVINSYAQNTGSGIKKKTTQNRQITGDPLASVSGVGQSIQVVGDNNTIRNVSAVNVASGATRLSAVDGQKDVTDRSGAATGQVRIINNTVSLGIHVPGQGFVQQTLGAQGLAQSAQVLSDANNVLNQMSLSVGLRAVKGISGVQLNELLLSLHGL